LFNAPQNWNHVSYQPSTGFADPRGMKPLLGNAAANSLTCHVREADANLLNLLPQSSPHFVAVPVCPATIRPALSDLSLSTP
jgi:hypothetical protein